MAPTNELEPRPMDDERYRTIQAHAQIVRGWRDTPDSYGNADVPLMAMILGADVLTLIAEVERLRSENAAMLPIVEWVADHQFGRLRTYMTVNIWRSLWEQARAVMAQRVKVN